MTGQHYGLIEAGGTKFVLGIADASRHLLADYKIPTTSPEETIAAAIEWLQSQSATYAGIGIASFGPLDLDRNSPQWGHITRTTKPGWSDTDVAGPLAAVFGCPVAIDTDVNGAALAEWQWGAGAGQYCSLYLTVGTGIGGGAVVGGKLLHGVSHPEMGHIRLARHPDDMGFAGICPFHGACLEGLASGPAVTARWGASLSELPVDHPGHGMIAWYLAQAVSTFQAIMEPGRVILGGGVMNTPGILDEIRKQAQIAHGGYFAGDPNELIVAPALGDKAGLMGALALIFES